MPYFGSCASAVTPNTVRPAFRVIMMIFPVGRIRCSVSVSSRYRPSYRRIVPTPYASSVDATKSRVTMSGVPATFVLARFRNDADWRSRLYVGVDMTMSTSVSTSSRAVIRSASGFDVAVFVHSVDTVDVRLTLRCQSAS